MNYYVINDNRVKAREAFVITGNEVNDLTRNYSGYYTVAVFDSEKEAEEFCTAYNNYVNEPDVELRCCSCGCTMAAYEYAHRGDGCVYEGRDFEAEEAENREYNEYYNKVVTKELALKEVPEIYWSDIELAINTNAKLRQRKSERTSRRYS